MLRCFVVDINVEGEGASTGLGARIRFRCSVRFRGI